MLRATDGLIPGGSTILHYVSPDGVVLYLAGGALAGTQGFELGSGADGLGGVASAEDEWDAAGDGIGEYWLGVSFKHGTLDLPIRVSGTTADEFRRRRDWLRQLMPRERQGWMCAYGSGSGWSWIPVRRGSIKPAYTRDPAGKNSATFDVLLLADIPLSRQMDDRPRDWVNTTGASHTAGSLRLYPGRERHGWPKFVFDGPGELRLVYAGNDVPIPYIEAGEQLQIDTTNGAQILRARRPGQPGLGRNLWPLMRGRQFANPLPPGEVTQVNFTVTRATKSTRLAARVPRWQEGLI
ncbi:hypothetical protein [Rhodococcus pyridinivorans]|uniref:Tail protein n=1 Tax=Rhodococcus pyridinivorans TaxID=103816 RepID=A0A7M2XQ85_9NOCA|nr:hypothetical protein [Rhodococcus pyridinivorans]QOV99502.1 hypothetical protein INP59_03620 [Rhodococcus pyridinivorans]